VLPRKTSEYASPRRLLEHEKEASKQRRVLNFLSREDGMCKVSEAQQQRKCLRNHRKSGVSMQWAIHQQALDHEGPWAEF
jgi:predicted esterase